MLTHAEVQAVSLAAEQSSRTYADVYANVC
jgi:hypothetical protein